MQKQIEILAPAGAFESVIAAVNCGADAVYIGAEKFSARGFAENFTMEQIEEAVKFCHARDVKVYLALNTIIFDRELQDALNLAKAAAKLNIDAVIVQDIGIAMILKKAIPGLALHGSTQMSIHTPAGAKYLYKLGFERVVLARELSFDEIKVIVDSCPIETEVFVHGALCWSVSGQCLFSSMLGRRSGNRGMCAQPCRLPAEIPGGNGYALSLKDYSLLQHLEKLQQAGVTSAKIEGRMKRPEYVAAAVSAFYAQRQNGAATDLQKENLKKVFSRTGFTDGYFTGRLTKEMFGRREHEDVTAANSEVLGQIRKTASSPCKHFAVDMHLCAKIGQPAKLTAKCGGLEVTQISEKICESAANTALTHEKAQQQLAKTGGTQYKLGTLTAQIEHGLALPLAELNQMRRSVLEELDEKRCKNYNYKINPIDFNFLQKPYKKEQNAQPLNIAYLKDENIAITHSQYDIVFLPLFADKNRFLHLQKQGIAVGAELPRVMFGIEPAILNRAKELAELGVNDFCLHNLGAVELLADLPVNKHGGFGLNICNTAALLWAEKAGLCSVTLSPELRLEQIENLGGNIARNALFFGLVPLTISRICPYKNAGRDCKTCKSEKFLQDRKGEKRTVFCQKNYVEILNNRVLSAPEKVSKSTAIDGLVYSFYVENYVETVDNPYEITQKPDVENNFTRGLYTRGVE